MVNGISQNIYTKIHVVKQLALEWEGRSCTERRLWGQNRVKSIVVVAVVVFTIALMSTEHRVDSGNMDPLSIYQNLTNLIN